MTQSIVPAVVVLLAVSTCVWIYLDARRRQAAGHPVVARIGSVEIVDPLVWLAGSVVLWILFVPLYATCRRQ